VEVKEPNMKKLLSIFALMIALGGIGVVFAASPAAADPSDCQWIDNWGDQNGPYWSECIADGGW
jgi:Spy/CpxP family protein refolding chaperone